MSKFEKKVSKGKCDKDHKLEKKCKNHKKIVIIPCDEKTHDSTCKSCGWGDIEVTPPPKGENGAIVSYYEASDDMIIPVGGLVPFSNIEVEFGVTGIKNLGNGLFRSLDSILIGITVLIPVDENGGTLTLATGATPSTLAPVERLNVHHSGSLGSIQRVGILPFPAGTYFGIMNNGTNPITIPANTPDGKQLYQSIQLVRGSVLPDEEDEECDCKCKCKC